MTFRKALSLVFTLLLAVMLAVSCNNGSTNEPPAPTPEPPEVKLLKIEIVNGSVDTECYVGAELDTSRIQLQATYSNKTRKTIEAADISIISPADTSKEGQTMLIVGYGGLSTSINITVNESFMTGISATGFENQYIYGSEISTDNIVVTVNYINGTSEVIPYGPGTGIIITLPDTTVAGMATIDITYKEQITKSYDVEILDPIVEITLDSPHRTFEFKQGFDLATIKSVLSNLAVNAVYTSGTVKELDINDVQIAYGQIDTSEITNEPKTFNVAYQGYVIPVNYTVKPVSKFSSMTLGSNNEFSTYYLPGDEVDDLSALKVKVTCSDGSVIDGIGAELLTITGYEAIDASAVGTYTLGITYATETDAVTTTVAVTVYGIRSVSVSGLKTEYSVGDKFDDTFAGVTVTIVYQNGDVAVVDYANKDSSTDIIADQLTVVGNVNTDYANYYYIAFKYFDAQSEPIQIAVTTDILPDADGDNVTEKAPL